MVIFHSELLVYQGVFGLKYDFQNYLQLSISPDGIMMLTSSCEKQRFRTLKGRTWKKGPPFGSPQNELIQY